LAEHVGFVLGGGASRVAIALRRLGFITSVFAEIGNDELASKIEKTFRMEKVDTSNLRQVDKVTSFTVGLNFQKERTLFVHHVESPHEFDFFSQNALYIYLASLGNPWQKAYEDAVRYKKEKNAKLVVNPGQSQFVLGRDSYLSALRAADIVFVNKEEAQIVTDIKTEDIRILLASVKRIGCGIGVITDGRNGSYAIDKNGSMFHIGIYPTKVVERTGAGDAYAAGFLAAIMQNREITEAMLWGTLNAASVVQEFGGLSGLLTKEKLDTILARSDLPRAKKL
jgi:sugar/nucleoside kinase (ribokinase family)